MRREELGGWSMIAGAVMMLVTMAFHPTSAERATLVLGVHAIALCAVPISFYGGWVLTRRLSAGGALPELALAFYGVAAVAAVLAATASGLMAPELVARAAALEGEAGAAAAGVARYNHALNQAFSKLWIAMSFAAVGLWSVEIERTRSMRRGTGIVGCVVAALVLLALFSGRVTLDVHGFGAVVLMQAVWLVLAGVELRRTAWG
jgi:hypothetical protein